MKEAAKLPATIWRSIVTVRYGRGFVVQAGYDRYVITAAHCLPRVPEAGPLYVEERTYPKLLGPLGEEPSVWAECLFVDPISDVAVLGGPDDQTFPQHGEAWEKLLGPAVPISIRAVRASEPAWLCPLEGEHLFRCQTHNRNRMWISKAAERIRGGMSGSPVISYDAKAIGIVCTSRVFSCGPDAPDEDAREGGPNPILSKNLPGWLLRELKVRIKAPVRPGA